MYSRNLALVKSVSNTHLTSVSIPDSVTSIGKYAFKNCVKLVNISIPDSVTVISDGAFYGCKKLISIHWSESLEQINYEAFENCVSLEAITFPKQSIPLGLPHFQTVLPSLPFLLRTTIRVVLMSIFSPVRSATVLLWKIFLFLKMYDIWVILLFPDAPL